MSTELRSIQQLSSELGITPRSVRFYEDKGLIQPRRAGTMRVYSHRELARMQLIMRGKRLGFTLRDIKEFLDLYDADPVHRAQQQLLLDRVRQRKDELEAQRHAVEQTLEELNDIERQVLERLTANDDT